MRVGDIVTNRTICDVYQVANTGGIRVSRVNNHIVLTSNPNGNGAYKNSWMGDTLHFVGRGSIGPQKLSRQNATLARSKQSGARVYLFEATGKGQYTYRGEVQLSGEPYIDRQPDETGRERFVWLFPLNVKPGPDESAPWASREQQYLPVDTYAVIGSQLDVNQRDEVERCLGDLRALGVTVVSQRDVETARYEAKLAKWYDKAMSLARADVRGIVRRLRKEAKEKLRPFGFAPDEVEVPENCDEQWLMTVLDALGMADASAKILQDARARYPMPDPPQYTQTDADSELVRLPGKSRSIAFDGADVS